MPLACLVGRLAWAAGVALALTFLFPIASQATPTFANYHLALGWPGSQVTAGAGWSSDLGVDYEFRLQDDGGVGTNPLVGVGQGSYSSSKPVYYADAGFDLHYELDRRGGAAGQTYSEGWLNVPNAGTVSPTQVFEFRLRSVLGANSAGYGISTGAQISGYWSFGNVTPADTLYYAIEWSATVTSAGQTYGLIELDGVGDPFNPFPRRPVVGQFAGNGYDILSVPLADGAQTLSGSDAGILGNVNYTGWNFQTVIEDLSGSPGEGVIDMTVRIAFSDTAIAGVPNTTSVPAPSGIPSLALGLLALGFYRRRQAV